MRVATARATLFCLLLIITIDDVFKALFSGLLKHSALQHPPTFSKVSERNIQGKVFKKVMCIRQLTIENASRAYRRNPANWAGADKALIGKNLDFVLNQDMLGLLFCVLYIVVWDTILSPSCTVL